MEKTNRKKCKKCGNEFEKENNSQTYCSEKCRPNYYKKNKKELICVNCNKSFQGSKTNKFCSSECKKEHMKFNRKTRIVKCVECGKDTTTKDFAHDNIFCGNKCRYAHNKHKKTYRGDCIVCGDEFESNYKTQKCCSNKCEGARRSEMARDRNGDSFPNQRARVEYKRRQRKIKTMVEKVELNRLIVRDKGICQICGELVDLRVHYNHHLAPTNDHIIPLALGGETSYENCHLAHRGCNSRKSHFVKVEEVMKWQDQQKVLMS